MGLWLHRLGVAFVLAFEALACLASVILLMLLSAAPLFRDALPAWPPAWVWAAMFLGACALAVAASWVKGIFDKRLPARIGGEPRHAHISGWTFVWIVLVMSIIVALATWASESDDNRAVINTDWGIAITTCRVRVPLLATTRFTASATSSNFSICPSAIQPFSKLSTPNRSSTYSPVAVWPSSTSLTLDELMSSPIIGGCLRPNNVSRKLTTPFHQQ